MLKKVKAAVCTVFSVLTISAAFSGCGEGKKSSTVETKPQATEETIVQPTTAVPTTVPSTTDSPSEKQRRYNFLAIKQKSDSIYTKLDDIITENNFQGSVYLKLGNDLEFNKCSGASDEVL